MARSMGKECAMTIRTATVLAAMSALAHVAAVADDAPIASSDAFTYAADTVSDARSVKTADDLAEFTSGVWRAGWGAGETIVLTAPDGTRTALASAAPSSGAAVLELDAGGAWTLAKGSETFTITVRHSIHGTNGDGTEASPAKVVDTDELVDLAAASALFDGWHFVLDGADGLLEGLASPPGYFIVEVGDGLYKLVSGGMVYEGGTVGYVSDSRMSGPDRKILMRDVLDVAFSGDGWVGDSEAGSMLSVTSPSGAEAEYDMTGTGATTIEMKECGDWVLVLSLEDGRTWRSTVRVFQGGFFMTIR